MAVPQVAAPPAGPASAGWEETRFHVVEVSPAVAAAAAAAAVDVVVDVVVDAVDGVDDPGLPEVLKKHTLLPISVDI